MEGNTMEPIVYFEVFLALSVIAMLALIAWSFIDILRSDFPAAEKPIWLVLVLLMPFVGAVLYMLIGRNKKCRNKGAST
jgi:tryptophan-rich sensory protein